MHTFLVRTPPCHGPDAWIETLNPAEAGMTSTQCNAVMLLLISIPLLLLPSAAAVVDGHGEENMLGAHHAKNHPVVY